MPDTAAPNIINLNIDSIQVECKKNNGHETQTVSKGYTNTATGDHTTQNTNAQNGQTTTISLMVQKSPSILINNAN